MANLAQISRSRATVTEDLEGLRISIAPRWSWVVVFPTVWLCAWTVGGLAAGLSLFRRFNLFICFWLVGWAIGEIMVGYQVLYAIGGREIVQAKAETLICRTQIFGVGTARAYLAAEIRDFRFQPEVGVGKGRIPSRIAFDYGDKVIGFAAGVDEQEATELIGRIRQRCAIVASGSTSQESGIKFWEKR